MNKYLYIIAITILIGVAVISPTAIAVDTSNPPQTEPEKACAEHRPDFDNIYTEWSHEISLSGNVSNEEFMNDLNIARNAYHMYVTCIFQFAQDAVWGVAESTFSASANAPTLSTIQSPDMNKPNEACISQDKLKEKVKGQTSPDQMLPPLLEIFEDYKTFLESKILPMYDQKVTKASSNSYNRLAISVASVNAFKLKVQTELENSLVAMDMAFTALTELRTAYVMHVHLQCMLKNLEKYRNIIESIRGVVEDLPSRLEDASTHQ